MSVNTEKINDGGPAFPVILSSENARDERISPIVSEGLTIRDWFAGMALQGFTANEQTCSEISNVETARLCYEVADAMLKAREVIE